MKKTIALIEQGNDGSFGIFTPDLQHVIIGEGETLEEAKEDFNNSFYEMLLSYSERSLLIPEELWKIEFEFKSVIGDI